MAKWLNHCAIASSTSGSGSTTETYDPSSVGSGTLTVGTLFTPTAGRLLVAVIYGQVTSSTPSGWTLPSNGSAINAGGLYVMYRTAAGSDTFTTVHNGNGTYPTHIHFYEYAAGSTFVASASSVNTGPTAAGPTLSPLTGTNLLFGVIGQNSSADAGGPTVEQFTWATGTEILDYHLGDSSNGGKSINFTESYLEDSVLTSASFTASAASFGGNPEKLTYAVNVAVGVLAVIPQGVIRPSKAATFRNTYW